MHINVTFFNLARTINKQQHNNNMIEEKTLKSIEHSKQAMLHFAEADKILKRMKRALLNS